MSEAMSWELKLGFKCNRSQEGKANIMYPKQTVRTEFTDPFPILKGYWKRL